jgi:hypothetical protein
MLGGVERKEESKNVHNVWTVREEGRRKMNVMFKQFIERKEERMYTMLSRSERE